MMHGYDWVDADLSGWICTEKMDGCRAYWTGAELRTKSGRTYQNLPAQLRASLPDGVALDCELWAPELHRGASLALATAAALRDTWDDRLRLTPFDLPCHSGPAAARIAALHSLTDQATPFRIALSTAQALSWRDAMHLAGREGLMCLDPAGRYQPGRRPQLLKLK